MAIETITFCPLGSECETVKDGKIHKCMWHIKVVGTDPQTGEDVDQYGCAMAWMPLIAVSTGKQIHSNTAAIESFRNEMVNANQVSQQIMLASTQLKLKQE